MESLTKGSVILIPFPFSNLERTKMRPAVVLADVGRQDYILCQITSNPYSDPEAIKLEDNDFTQGTLKRVSYARPGKLFTANQELITSTIGQLKASSIQKVIHAVIQLLKREG